MKISLIILFRLLDKELHQDISPEQALGLDLKRQGTEIARVLSYKARVAHTATLIKYIFARKTQKIAKRYLEATKNGRVTLDARYLIEIMVNRTKVLGIVEYSRCVLQLRTKIPKYRNPYLVCDEYVSASIDNFYLKSTN